MTSEAIGKKLMDIIDRKLTKLIPEITKSKAIELRDRLKVVAKVWREDVFNWMSADPAPGMPTRRTGQLVNALHYSTERLTKLPNGGYRLSVRHWWDRTISKTSGEDYGSIINEVTRVRGYRDRVKDELHLAISKVLEER